MHIAHLCSGAAAAAFRLVRPGRKAGPAQALASAVLILACSAAPSFAQSFVSSVDNINGPTFVALDHNRAIAGTTSTWLYVSEHGNTNNTGGGRVLRYNVAALSAAPVDIGAGHFVSPDGIVIDAASGDLIIADRAQNKITRIANDGTVRWTFGSGAAGAADEMHGPCGLAIDAAGALYVTEHGETLTTPPGAGGNFVSKYTVSATGQAQRQFRIGGTGAGNGQFANTGPYGIAVANGELLVSDGFNARVQVFGLDGTYLRQFSLPNTLPLGLQVDAAGAVWVAESSGQGDGPIQQVQKMSTAGVTSGSALTSTAPALSLPFDVAVDATANRAYVADYGNHRVAIFDLSATSGGTSSGGTTTGGTSTGGTTTGGSTSGGSTSGGDTTGGTSTGGSSTGGSDTAGVAITAVTVPANGTYRAGDALIFKVRFSGPIKVSGAGGDDDREGKEEDDDDAGASIAWTALGADDSGKAVLVGPIGATELTFKYQVRGNDRAPQGIKLGASLSLAAGVRISDTAGHGLTAAQLTLPWASNPLTGVVLVPANESNPGHGGDTDGHGKGKKHGRLVNLSSRVHVKHGDAAHAIVVGFVVSGTGTQSVLIRAIGPGLKGFGIIDALTDPTLSVQDNGGRVLALNGGWSNNPLVGEIAQKVGAFGLQSGSRDSAVVLSLAPGAYTATIAGKNGDGEALIEVYDAVAANDAAPQLVNMSTRGFVDADENLIVGFVVQGTDPKRVLVRAVGPGLSGFGVANALGDPTLEVRNSAGIAVAGNDDWTAPQADASHTVVPASEVAAAATTAGAFPLANASKDSALVATLAPGAYTAVVTGARHTAGAILVEVYELDTP